jgi:hypothetical protein
MPGKTWRWIAALAVAASAGCCHWCERHCAACRPQTCCVPCCPSQSFAPPAGSPMVCYPAAGGTSYQGGAWNNPPPFRPGTCQCTP